MDEGISEVIVLEKPPINIGETTPTPTPELSTQQLEKKLGIETNTARLLEASLFIDKKFLDVAIITGIPPHPELMFGEKEWNAYLAARLETRQHGPEDLSVDFITSLHKTLTAHALQKDAGKIRNVDRWGADFADPAESITFTPNQLRAIKENKYLSFQSDGKSEDGGYIVYDGHPYAKSFNSDVLQKHLADVCKWYNEYKNSENYNPFTAAALLQHKVVSIHPFLDGNGTLSRLLMNWSLESDGQSPSILEDPNNDVLTDEFSWVAEVCDGSFEHDVHDGAMNLLKEIGIEDEAYAMGLEPEKTFYNYVFQKLEKPPIPIPGRKLDEKVYVDYMTKFKDELEKFQELMSSDSTIKPSRLLSRAPWSSESDLFPDGTTEKYLYQGGLLPSVYAKLFTKNPSQLSDEAQQLLFTDLELYRGGNVDVNVTDDLLCGLFVNPAPLTASYASIQKAHASPLSPRPMDISCITSAVSNYNRLMADYYLEEYLNKDDNAKITELIYRHVNVSGDFWKSPFVSTSIDLSQSEHWATESLANYGILFKSYAPKVGTVLTYGTKGNTFSSDIERFPSTVSAIPGEREVLIAGGILPASIFQIEVYDHTTEFGFLAKKKPVAIARRMTSENGTTIISVADSRGEFVINKKYEYDPRVKKFKLVETVTTETLTPQAKREREFAEAEKLYEATYVKSIYDEQKPLTLAQYESSLNNHIDAQTDFTNTSSDKIDYPNKNKIEHLDEEPKKYIYSFLTDKKELIPNNIIDKPPKTKSSYYGDELYTPTPHKEPTPAVLEDIWDDEMANTLASLKEELDAADEKAASKSGKKAKQLIKDLG